MKRIMLNLLGLLAVCAALNIQLSIVMAQGKGFSTLVITNPAPADNDLFGASLAAVGDELVLIGSPFDGTEWTGGDDVGAAYLFSTDGTLLTAFTNPTPAAYEYFGNCVAAAGSDRVIIGAYYENTRVGQGGAAYLFNTNGTLLTTFTNPTPLIGGSRFGKSVAAVGSDKVLIGAEFDYPGAAWSGAAYLFGTNGTWLTTFTNPTPAISDNFGNSVAAVGSDRVLIGARYDDTGAEDAGAAYMFSTDGTLLTTFTNPTPTDYEYFGVSVMAVGNDRVVIGANGGIKGMDRVGEAYLFSTNGTLLTTFLTPTSGANFGSCLAAVGNNRVLIGASFDHTGADGAGAAYLFSANGTLLTTFTNPTPVAFEFFGISVAAVGSDQVLIGASYENRDAGSAGAAYLFSPIPSLTIRPTATNTVAVSWPSPSTGWTLQQNTNNVGSVNWSNAPGPIQDDDTNKTLIVNPPIGNRFYRLFKP